MCLTQLNQRQYLKKWLIRFVNMAQTYRQCGPKYDNNKDSVTQEAPDFLDVRKTLIIKDRLVPFFPPSVLD